MEKKISICSNALLLLGHTPIASLDEPGAGALLSKNLYESTYLNFLSINSWNFAKKHIALNRLSETPNHPNYTYQYQLPTDYVRIQTVLPISDYMIFEDKVYSNVQNLTLDYYYNIREELLPPYAVRAMEYSMAAVLAMPLTVDASKAKLYAQLFQQQLLSAMSIDAQGIPSQGWSDTPVTSVRFS